MHKLYPPWDDQDNAGAPQSRARTRVNARIERNSSHVKSLDRAIDVLEALAQYPDGVTITGLASSIRLPKSSVFRVLSTLRERGYVLQNQASERYSLGFRFLSLARAVAQEGDLRNVATEYLHRLRDETGETVHLAVPVGFSMIYIDKVESARLVRLASRIGDVANLHCTGLGKAYLAALPESERKAIVANLTLERRTSRTHTDKEMLLKELDRCGRQDFAIDDVENEEGVRCVGAAVRTHRGEPIAAISVSAPSSRFSKKLAVAAGPVVARSALDISRHLSDVGSVV
jgi:DNA-binding IclR family transcriptional regulator